MIYYYYIKSNYLELSSKVVFHFITKYINIFWYC